MTKRTAILAAAVAMVMAWSSQSYALTISSPLTYSDPYVVGTIDGAPSYNSGKDAEALANALLALAANASGTVTVGGTDFNMQAGTHEFSGTVNGTKSVPNTSCCSIPAGFDYILVKYDGKQAGLVLFYLGGEAATIPQYPYDFWTDNTTQYGFSNFVGFTSNNVPDGGATLILLGGAMACLGAIRRKISA